jgi:Arc/MetJ-type ribon-helix-helix transcriptional regulator
MGGSPIHGLRTGRALPRGMVLSMATSKITITVPAGQLAEIKRRVTAREATSISGFVQRAVQKSLENEAEFRAMISEDLVATGGPLTASERAWARKMLTSQKRGARARNIA